MIGLLYSCIHQSPHSLFFLSHSIGLKSLLFLLRFFVFFYQLVKLSFCERLAPLREVLNHSGPSKWRMLSFFFHSVEDLLECFASEATMTFRVSSKRTRAVL